MIITCIKILPYTYHPKNISLENFKFATNILNHTIDPPTNHPSKITAKTSTILCSPMKRAYQCIKLKPKQQILKINELKEIPFILHSTNSNLKQQKYNSKIVRKQFKEGFINDTLLISREKIKKELKALLIECQNYTSVTIISHTFRLIILKAFIETNGTIISKPQLINKYIKNDIRILDFGEKFNLNINTKNKVMGS